MNNYRRIYKDDTKFFDGEEHGTYLGTFENESREYICYETDNGFIFVYCRYYALNRHGTRAYQLFNEDGTDAYYKRAYLFRSENSMIEFLETKLAEEKSNAA